MYFSQKLYEQKLWLCRNLRFGQKLELQREKTETFTKPSLS